MKKATVLFDVAKKCPFWDKDDGTCKNPDGPAYCTAYPDSTPSGHCPFPDVPDINHKNWKFLRIYWNLKKILLDLVRK